MTALFLEEHRHLSADERLACRVDAVQNFDWRLRELPAISPFSFPIYASVIKESMMLEDPAVAIERIYHEMYGRLETVTGRRGTVDHVEL